MFSNNLAPAKLKWMQFLLILSLHNW